MRLSALAALSVLSSTLVMAQEPKEKGISLAIVRAIVFKDRHTEGSKRNPDAFDSPTAGSIAGWRGRW